MKKFLTFILVLTMVMSVSSVALAVSGAGTESDPYIVTNETELNAALAEIGTYIKLGNSFNVSNKITIEKSVTIDGNYETLTYTGSDRAITVESDAPGVNLEIKNLTIEFTKPYCQRGINYNTNGNLTLDNVKVNGGAAVTYALNLPGSSNNCTITVKNSELTGNIAINAWGSKSTINVEKTKLTSVDDNDEEGYAAVKLNNNGGTSAEGTVINVEGGSINVTGSSHGNTYVGLDPTVTGKIIISSSTDIKMNDGKPNTKEQYVAIINYPPSDNFYSFKTLAEAVEAAKDGDTITLLTDDVDVSSIQTVKKLTIETKDGKEYVTKNGEVGVNAGGVFVTPPELKFGTVQFGYDPQNPKQIQVSNVPQGYTVTFTATGDYEVSGDLTNPSYAPSAEGERSNQVSNFYSTAVFVRPEGELGVGQHEGYVNVTFNNPNISSSAAPALVRVKLDFKVEAATNNPTNPNNPTNNPSSGGPSVPDVEHIGGNTFSVATNQAPISVEIDGAIVPFTMNGNKITVGCIQPGSRWITVNWGNVSNTVSFTPDANAYCAQTVIPKTGGMSIWAAIAQFLGF